MPELGIVDIREIIRVVKSEYDYDFGNYALTSFKQRLERLMALYSIGTMEALAEKLKKENDFFDTFLHDITVPSTEMFRDPSLWRWLREEYFPRVMDKFPGQIQNLAARLCFRRRIIFPGYPVVGIRIARQGADHCQLPQPAKH